MRRCGASCWRDTGEPYDAFLTRLAEALRDRDPHAGRAGPLRPHPEEEGIERSTGRTPTIRTSKIIEDEGRPHPDLAHTAEHAVDLETGAIVGVTDAGRQRGRAPPPWSLTLITAVGTVFEAVGAAGITESSFGDKGYHSNETMEAFVDLGVRSYVSERGSRAAQLGGQGRGPEGRCRCESSSAFELALSRATAVVVQRGELDGTAQRPSLRDRRDAPRASARASQYPETFARARLRLQSRVADAAADGRGHAAEPPGPRGGGLRAR